MEDYLKEYYHDVAFTNKRYENNVIDRAQWEKELVGYLHLLRVRHPRIAKKEAKKFGIQLL